MLSPECEQCALEFIQDINRLRGQIKDVNDLTTLFADVPHFVDTLLRINQHLEEDLTMHREHFSVFKEAEGCFCEEHYG